ncbi:MAG: acyltransferase [Oscillospiraceae bacterium]|nr:acyltransferase [Oscillospiraceae bacterium]
MTTENPASQLKERYLGIDIIKILAFCLVVCVHFFLHTGYYSTQITQDFGLPQIFLRWVAYLCVPLFMITTGYLMRHKTLSRKYYFGLVRVLVIYVIISFISMYVKHRVYQETYSPWKISRLLLSYAGVDYAWYVEVYITIFMLIPFINAAYNAMGTKKKKLAMVLTVIMLTTVSQSVYLGNDKANQIRVFPGCYLGIYMVSYYPIAYYLVGMYIRDYPSQKRKWLWKLLAFEGFIASIAVLGTNTLLHTAQSEQKTFLSWHFDNYGALPVFIAACCLFLILFDLRCSKPLIKKCFAVISNGTFAAYLFSYIFDIFAYKKLFASYTTIQEYFRHAPITIARVIFPSLICGILLQCIYDKIVLIMKAMLHNRFRKKSAD